MKSHFPQHVARIRSSGESAAVVGAGFLLEGGFVMTCAHVVAVALGRDEVARCEVGEIVILDLPSMGRVGLRASIAAFFPMVRSDRLIDDPVADIAVLRLEDSSVSGGLTPGCVNRRLVPGQHFTTFGFPSGYDQGTAASGEVVVKDFWGWAQVVDKDHSGYFLTPGFSGAPALAAGGTELIGMVCQSETDERLRLGALIPADTLCKAWPPLAQPYQRLEKFTEHESDMFFGREEFVTELNGKLGRSPFAMVVGPSGSGKSSVVLAGLVPALRKDEWIVVHCRPLEDPLNELASGFARVQIGLDDLTARLGLADKWAGWLRKDPRRIFEIAREMSAGARRQKPVLLVIDQFEELFTNDAAAHDGAVRRKDAVTPDNGSPRQKAFLEVLEAIAGQEPASRLPIRAVATLRADYMDAALRIGSLARLMKDADVKLGPMRTPELTAAIEKPAEHFRVGFENGLVPEIVSEMKGRPGGLPLLQFTLDRLWRRQEDRRLTWKGYQGEDGRSGLATALDEHAEDVRREIDDDDGLRRVMLQLVRVAEGLPDARAVVGRARFSDADWRLIETLARERLVMIATATDCSQTAEVVHEALIASWKQLTTWLNEDRKFRHWHQRLVQSLQDYRVDPEGSALTGRRLAEAEDWLQTHKERFTAEEVEFVEDCRELEAKDKRRVGRIRKTILGGLFALTLASIAAALLAIISSREREYSREVARLNTAISTEQAILRARALLWSGSVNQALLLLLNASSSIETQGAFAFDEALVDRLTVAISQVAARATRETRFLLPDDTRAISSPSGLYLHDTNLGSLSIVTEEGVRPLGRIAGRIIWIGAVPGRRGIFILARNGREIAIFRRTNREEIENLSSTMIPTSLPDAAFPTISINSAGLLELNDWRKNEGEHDARYYENVDGLLVDPASPFPQVAHSPEEPPQALDETEVAFEARLRASSVWEIIADWRQGRDAESAAERDDYIYTSDPELLLATCLGSLEEIPNFDTIAQAILDGTKPDNGSRLNGGSLASCQVVSNRILINSFYGGSAGVFVHSELYQVADSELASSEDGVNLSSSAGVFVQRVFHESFNVSESDAIDDPLSISLPKMSIVPDLDDPDSDEPIILWSDGGRALNLWSSPWDIEEVLFSREIEASAFIGDGSHVALVTSRFGVGPGSSPRELVVVAVNGPVHGDTVLLGSRPTDDLNGSEIERLGFNALLSIDASATDLGSTFPRAMGRGNTLHLVEDVSRGLAIVLRNSEGEDLNSLILPLANSGDQSSYIVSSNLGWSMIQHGRLVRIFDAKGDLFDEVLHPADVVGVRFLGPSSDILVSDGSSATTIWQRGGPGSWKFIQGPSVDDGGIGSALPDASGRYAILIVNTGAQELSVRLHHLASGDQWGELVEGYKWAFGDFSSDGVAYGHYVGITEFSIPSLSQAIEEASALVSDHCRPQGELVDWQSSPCWGNSTVTYRQGVAD